MADNAERLERALRALAVLRAQTTRDKVAMAEAISPEMQATLAKELLREFSNPPDVAAVNEYIAETAAAHDAARKLYLGMNEVALAMATLVAQGSSETILDLLQEVERMLRAALGTRD